MVRCVSAQPPTMLAADGAAPTHRFCCSCSPSPKWSSALMAVTKNCLAQNKISTCFNHGRVFSHVANGQVKLQSFKKGRWMECWHIGAAMFCLVPKNWDFKTNMSTETWSFECSNGAVWRKQNLERNREKTYIASAGSTSAKRSWGPCWKFNIALGCLKLQETEFYLCFTGIKSVHDPVISWHSSTPCKIWGSNGRLDWKQWR